MTSVLHATANAVTNLLSYQASILLNNVCTSPLHWLDDMLLYGITVLQLLAKILSLFKFCAAYNIKLHPAKFPLFALSCLGCGPMISQEDIRLDLRQLDDLLNKEELITSAHQQ